MKNEREILQDLLSKAEGELALARQEANNIYNDLVSLCILRTILDVDTPNIMFDEEISSWENRNVEIEYYEHALQNINIWSNRMEALKKVGLSQFREAYGRIDDQTAFVRSLLKPD